MYYYTFQDAFEHLRDFLGTHKGDGSTVRDIKKAIYAAFDLLPTLHQWRYFKKHMSFWTDAPYSTGTITYLHSSGAVPNQVTLTGGTWPSWAQYGFLELGNFKYEPYATISPTVLQLKPDNNPGSDIAVASAYNLYHISYPLPYDFLSIGRVRYSQNWELEYAYTEDLALSIYQPFTAGLPAYFGLYDNVFSNRRAIKLFPIPQASDRCEFEYKRQMRPLQVIAETAGTLTITQGQTAVTGVGTNFLSKHGGSVLRVGPTNFNSKPLRSGDTLPTITGLVGEQPYAFESSIFSVTDATHLTLLDPADQTLTGVSFIISDPIDVEVQIMRQLFLRTAEAQLAILRNLETEKKVVDRWKDAVLRAKESDARYISRRVAGSQDFLGPTWQSYPVIDGTP